jgi:hypothetical protein
MISLFQFEINALKAEINALKAEVEMYEQAETLINGALTDLQKSIVQIKAFAPSTIVKFQESATALFEADTNETSNNDNCDNEEERGWQDIKTKPHVSPTKFTPHFKDKVGYFHTSDGHLGTCYLAANNKFKLEIWGHYLVRSKSASGFEIRPAKRLINYKHELKIWGIQDLKILYQIDTNQLPPSAKLAEEDTSSCPLPKLYKVRSNLKVVFETENCSQAFDFYQKEIKKPTTKVASLLSPNSQILEHYFVPDESKLQPERHSPEIEAELDNIKANPEPIHPVPFVQSHPEFNGLNGLAGIA